MRIFTRLFITFMLLNTTTAFTQSSTVYFYAVGWEYLPQTEAAKLNAQPVVSNVVRINCKGYIYNSSLGVDNQLSDYYKAYHAKERGYLGLNRTIAFGPYDSWDEAEKHRRANIADYQLRWKPFILQRFKYLCVD